MTVHYALHSVVRKKDFRFHRAGLPEHMARKHYLVNGTLRLVPERRLLISEDMLKQNLEEIRQKAAQHILEVRTVDGRLVNLDTFEALPGAPIPPLPRPRLDSVADDVQVGQYIPPYAGDDGVMPQTMAPGQRPALLAQAALEYGEEVATSAAPDADAELDAALEAAQNSADPSAPMTSDAVSSGKDFRSGRRNRR
jgi:hypothetical protein